ncbi:hypothetical protein Tco_0343885 [Tanacetum coccineum]
MCRDRKCGLDVLEGHISSSNFNSTQMSFNPNKIPNCQKRECGIRFILAPKSARAFFTTKGPIRHGSVKLPGSPSFWGRILWIIAEHSSLSLAEEAAFSSFSLCERRFFRTLDPFDMWIMASRKGRLILIRLKMDRSRSSSSSFFCFFTRERKGKFDNLEG